MDSNPQDSHCTLCRAGGGLGRCFFYGISGPVRYIAVERRGGLAGFSHRTVRPGRGRACKVYSKGCCGLAGKAK